MVPEANQILLLCHLAWPRGGTQIYSCNPLLIRKFRGNAKRHVVGYNDIIIFSQMITVAATTSNNYN